MAVKSHKISAVFYLSKMEKYLSASDVSDYVMAGREQSVFPIKKP